MKKLLFTIMLLLPSISFAQGQGLGEGLGFRIEHESSNFLLISIITIYSNIVIILINNNITIYYY